MNQDVFRHVGRLVFCLMLVGGVVFLWQLPADTITVSAETELFTEIGKLPDFDLRTQAKNLWENKDRLSAMALLEEIIRQDLPDRPAAEADLKKFQETLESENTLLGKLYRTGRGFLLGSTGTMADLGGAVLGDLIGYGDFRDLVVESFKDDPDEFIRGLSAFGALTTIWPPADSACSLLKIAAKENALTPELKGVYSAAGKSLENLPKTVEEAKRLFEPVWHISEEIQSFNQFSLFTRGVRSLEDLKGLSRFLKKYPGVAKRLETALILAESLKDGTRRTLEYVDKHGNAGMQALYSAIRKGPKGLELLLEARRLPKPIYKSGVAVFQTANSYWRSTKIACGSSLRYLMEAGRFLGLFAFLSLLLRVITTWFPGVPELPSVSDAAAKGNPAVALETVAHWYVPVAVVVVAIFLINPFQESVLPTGSFENPVVGGLSGNPGPLPPIGEGGALAAFQVLPVQENSNFLSWFLIVFFAGLQICAFVRAKSDFDEIERMKDNDPKKAKQLENIEVFLDLPLYIGLAGSVVSFILITAFPSSLGRLLAYVSTLFGIFFSGILKFRYLYPARKAIIQGGEGNTAGGKD